MTVGTIYAIAGTTTAGYLITAIVNTAPDDPPSNYRLFAGWLYRWIIRAAKMATNHRQGFPPDSMTTQSSVTTEVIHTKDRT